MNSNNCNKHQVGHCVQLEVVAYTRIKRVQWTTRRQTMWTRGGTKSRIRKSQSTNKKIMRFVWKIQEIAKDTCSFVMKLRCATCQVGIEESRTRLKGSWNWKNILLTMVWKVHELAWNSHKIGFTLLWSHLSKGVIYTRYIEITLWTLSQCFCF